METGEGRSHVCLEWKRTGDDLLVTITGGERPHIGAAALAWPEGDGVSASQLSAPGHKEGALALDCARAIAAAVQRTVLVSCGIHIDSALPHEIALLCDNARLLWESLAARLEGTGSLGKGDKSIDKRQRPHYDNFIGND